MSEFFKNKKFHIVLIFLLGLVLYGRTLADPFVMDDEEQIVNNHAIHSVFSTTSISELFRSSTMNTGGTGKMTGMYYKPVMMTAYALIWSLCEASPVGYHAVQLAVHAANAALFYLLLGYFLEPLVCLFLALVFLVHPLNSEVVLYVADLQDALFVFFGLVGLWICVRSVRLKEMDFGQAGLLFLAVLLSFLSKETGILFAAISLLFLFQENRKSLKSGSFAVLAAGGVYAALRFGYAGLTNIARNDFIPIARLGFAERLLNTPGLIAHYLWTFVFPFSLSLGQDAVITQASVSGFWLPLLVLVILGLGVLMLKKSRHAVFFLIWLGLGLLLHSQIVALDATSADRWFYFPMMGFLGFFGLWIAPYLSLARRPARSIILIGLCGFMIALMTRSWVRSENWVDGLTLYSHDVRENPSSFLLNNNVGVELFRHGQIEESRRYFEVSTRINPAWTVNWSNLGAALEALGQTAATESCYAKSIANGDYYLAYENYAKILLKQGHVAEALVFVEKTGLPKFPNNPTLLALQSSIRGLPNR